MSTLTKLAQRFQSIENLAPKPWRLPIRYHGQHLVGGLEPEMLLLHNLVQRGGVALDIGANRGIYAYALSHLASRVHCFEPLVECCRYIQACRSKNITVHNVALSDQAGKLELHVPIIEGRTVYTRASLDRPNGPFESREVGVRTLDSYSLMDVAFVKIDVEGLEAAVLRGAQYTLEACHPTLLVEIDRARHTQESFMCVHGWLKDRGYAVHVCVAGKLASCVDPWTESKQHINFIFT